MKKIVSSIAVIAVSAAVMLGVVEVGRADTPSPVQLAQAPTGGSAVTIPPFEAPKEAPATETSTATGSAAPAPSSTLHDPIADTGAAWDDVKAAKKVGWTAAVFAALLLLGKLAARAKNVGALAWLGKGRAAIVTAGALTVAAGCYDVAVQGGSPLSVAMAGLLALGVYLNPHPKAPEA